MHPFETLLIIDGISELVELIASLCCLLFEIICQYI
jgi:hypothetical protein